MKHIFEEVILRWFAAFALLVGIYNPSNFSLAYWAQNATQEQWPFIAVIAILLAIILFVFLRATYISLGAIGIAVLILLFGAIGWSMFNLGWIDTSEHNLLFYLAVAATSFILAIGSYWSRMYRRFSGQVEVTES